MVRTPGAAIPSTQPPISRSSFSACSSNKTKSECQWCVETLHHPLLLLQDPHLPFSESPSAKPKAKPKVKPAAKPKAAALKPKAAAPVKSKPTASFSRSASNFQHKSPIPRLTYQAIYSEDDHIGNTVPHVNSTGKRTKNHVGRDPASNMSLLQGFNLSAPLVATQPQQRQQFYQMGGGRSNNLVDQDGPYPSENDQWPPRTFCWTRTAT
ncbi:hypothetical protein ACFX12_025735 [Malus domestica]